MLQKQYEKDKDCLTSQQCNSRGKCKVTQKASLAILHIYLIESREPLPGLDREHEPKCGDLNAFYWSPFMFTNSAEERQVTIPTM